jgi:hypothetical protein
MQRYFDEISSGTSDPSALKNELKKLSIEKRIDQLDRTHGTVAKNTARNNIKNWIDAQVRVLVSLCQWKEKRPEADFESVKEVTAQSRVDRLITERGRVVGTPTSSASAEPEGTTAAIYEHVLASMEGGHVV